MRTHRAGAAATALFALLVPALAAAPAATSAPAGSVAQAPGSTLAAVADAPKGKPKGRAKPVTVMTRNIYLGADIFRPLKAAQEAMAAGKPADQVLHAVAVANDETKRIVGLTDFHVRARLLAREIKKAKPALVGLQEVALWRSGPIEMDKIGVPNATTVDYDFLAILKEELARTGAKYSAVVVGTRADVEAPAWTATGADKRDERLTMHDVILKRRGAGVKVQDTQDRIFEVNLPVTLAGIEMNFDRGYQWADVKMGKREFRFVNTHLEAASSDIAYGQAAEIVEKVVKPKRTTVMVCDCNSDPLDDSIKPTDTVPHKTAYDFLVGSGMVDQWLEWAPAKEGWTSGLSELVNDPTAAGFDHRIDLVLARTPSGEPLQVKRGDVTGDEVSDRDAATGLWPSDHAGVVLKLKGLPRG